MDRREVGVKGSYTEDDADEKLVPLEGTDMGWLHMLKLSSMSNLKSDSNCMATMTDGRRNQVFFLVFFLGVY